MRWVLVVMLGCSKPESAAAITERAWRAHERVIAAGEEAKGCPAAGAAMQAAFARHRQDFVDAMSLDRDKDRLAEAAAYIEANDERYRTIEARMAALADRCADDPSVTAAFREMESP